MSLTSLLAVSAHAADLTWGGLYRAEAVKIVNSELTSGNSDKAYLLHHLVLNPKLVAADGLTIFSRLDVLNSSVFGINGAGQVGSVAGDVIGNGPGSATPVNGTDSNSWGRTERAGGIAVTALYMSWAQEFGQLVVGRTPVHFGLGTAVNAGNGMFDHYIDTVDAVAYKMVMGNLFILPMMGKVSEGASVGQEDDVDDYSVQVQYDNPESELSLGFLYKVRVVTGNDAPISGALGGAGVTRTASYKNSLMGLFFSEKVGSSARIGLEADMLSGDTGVKLGSNGLGLNAFGIAAEVSTIPAAESKWGGSLKFGLASGDDPGTTDTYEGFAFSRNYDVGMLLFNHPLGQADFLRTGMVRDTGSVPSSQIDTEAISNVMYIAPNLTFRQRDNLSYGGTLVYGMLNKDPIGGGVNTDKNLGFEVDLNVNYKPMERLTWITEAGVLLPGEAWKAGSTGLEAKMVYGFITKAAINF